MYAALQGYNLSLYMKYNIILDYGVHPLLPIQFCMLEFPVRETVVPLLASVIALSFLPPQQLLSLSMRKKYTINPKSRNKKMYNLRRTSHYMQLNETYLLK